MINVAICDDDKNIREYIKKIIEVQKIECRILEYESGNGLIETDEKLDIVFLDIKMDGIDGIRAAEILREKQMRNDKNPIVFVLVPSISVVSLSSIIFGINLFQNVIRLNEEKRNRIIIEKQITNMQEHIKEIDSLYDGIRGMKHDMKNSIFVMKQLMEKMGLDLSDKTLEINKYLLGMDQTMDKLDFRFLTGNPVTDVVINDKYIEASKRIEGLEIEFDGFIFPSNLKISAFDIGVILINALDNAIEACRKIKQKQLDIKTFIHLKSFKRGKLFFIEVENSFDGKLIFNSLSDLPVTSKREKELHGIGLKNIRNSARKYYGDVDCMVNDKTFSLSVMLKENK